MAVMDATNVPDPVVDPAAEPVEQPSVTPEPTGLPSDNEPEAKTPWERARDEGYLPADAKEDPYELAKQLATANKYVQDANAEKAKAGKAAEKQQAAEATQAEILSMVPEFMANDMQLTPEMEAKATEMGVDIRDLKLGAIEVRDNMQNMYAVVGGEAEYAAMMADMGETMTDDEKRMFNADIGGKAGKYAVAGLHAAWKAKAGGKGTRIKGKVGGQSGAKPYESQAEVLKDLNYLRTRGKGDKAAWAQHEKRKAVTPDAVIYGR